ncbi:gluconokinase [Mobilicoccus pelagius]|uniref:Gluconokinase n=1 Tax=Mobilicoccus pelagius NBRC 104925 TaxID=1089455 RepID=H5UR44_9MICO|nr:gluconokinase [Mobilicoccus pelagius]GAB48202.1 gluconokinase [Mobilicoccus pelagius NBRC 104925]
MATENGPRHVVVMGVSGSGKSTVAGMLRERTGWEFAEADDCHPQANIDKMAAGTPLTDEDRLPWLKALAAWMAERGRGGRSSIITCSALKRSYRDLLREAGDVTFAHLDGTEDVLSGRMSGRSGHFMPSSLLRSQLDTLEALGRDERGLVLDVRRSPEDITEEILRHLDLAPGESTAD